MLEYWPASSSTPRTSPDEKPLLRCLHAIQQDILRIWNLRDQDQVLVGNEFKAMLIRLIQDLVDPDTLSQHSASSQDAKPLLSGLASVSPPFFNWLCDTYYTQELSPPALCILMGFIVDLTMVLERLFWIVFHRNFNSINMDIIHEVFNEYNQSGNRVGVHRAIQTYVTNVKPKRPDEAREEVARLIQTYRSVRSRSREDPRGGGRKRWRFQQCCHQ